MPVSSRSQKAEERYNVTTEFPHLGLHSAAATGNIGLVKYALSHGQPINSVIDGVLPLHAACSGGNDLVVKLLIEYGADVNAPRLPRRYSDKSRTSSAPIVGTSGSAPLHFAAANGHTAVVRTLLRHGARPSRADKHGVTPEMLARANGWVGCADTIAQWVADKDRDLRERETLLGGAIPPDEPESICDHPDCTHQDDYCPLAVLRRKLGVKNPVDKPTSSTVSSPPTPDSPSLRASTPESTPEIVQPPRRPSLSQMALSSSTGSRKSGSRRPSSAGTGASSTRRLGSKYSLLQMFRKQSADELVDGSPIRPSILRAHAQSSSSSGGGSGQRLRFDSASSGSAQDDSTKDEGARGDGEDDDEEEEYGQPIAPRILRRPRGQSASSQQSLPSPLSKSATIDFPFSIDRPPPEDESPQLLLPDGRIRGDSQSTTFSVRTPAPVPAYLPPPRIASPGSVPQELEPFDDEVGVDGKGTPCPALSIEAREISSHAQAEAFVQRAQRSILDLESEAPGDVPLSARLAAYGESLRIERKFKMKEMGEGEVDEEEELCEPKYMMERRASESVGTAPERPYGTKARSASATLDRESAIAMLGAVGGRRSLEQWGSAGRGRTRRPHTAGGTARGDDMFLSPTREVDPHRSAHFRSRSAAPPRIDAELANTLAASPDSTVTQMTQTAALPPRARTPDPQVEPLGVPLTRVTTAPPLDTLNDLLPSRRDHPPHVLRANKLARMGFAPEKAERMPVQGSPRSHHRLGGLKSFVQSLKGK